jgi:hypothetical protein
MLHVNTREKWHCIAPYSAALLCVGIGSATLCVVMQAFRSSSRVYKFAVQQCPAPDVEVHVNTICAGPKLGGGLFGFI